MSQVEQSSKPILYVCSCGKGLTIISAEDQSEHFLVCENSNCPRYEETVAAYGPDIRPAL